MSYGINADCYDMYLGTQNQSCSFKLSSTTFNYKNIVT